MSKIDIKQEKILGGLWGSLVGDALGVPVEFKDRAIVQLDPVRDMREFGTHRQPRGTWSDTTPELCRPWTGLAFSFWFRFYKYAAPLALGFRWRGLIG